MHGNTPYLNRTSNRIRSSLLLISNQENNYFMRLETKINTMPSQEYAKQFDFTNVTMIQTYNVSSSQGSSIHKKKTGNILRIPTASSNNQGGASSTTPRDELRKKKVGKSKLKHSKTHTLTSESNNSTSTIANESYLDKSFESVMSVASSAGRQEEKTTKSKEAKHFLKNLLLLFKAPKAKVNKSFLITSKDALASSQGNIYQQISLKMPMNYSLSKDDF